MDHVTLPIEPGSRWRHWRCTDTDKWDVIVLAVVEHDGAAWVVHGDALLADSPFCAKPDVTDLTDFVTKYTEATS